VTIRKAIIPAAGWGTRFLPATKAVPKEMLPLVDKPMIQYVVEEAVASGITEIIIVIAHGKDALEHHFDTSFELELFLKQKGETGLLEEVQRISRLCGFCYIRQEEQLGLGHAVLIAKELIGDEPFAVLLPDDIIVSEVPALRQLLNVYQRYKSSVIAVERVARENIKSYGIIEPLEIGERVCQVIGAVEKPEPEDAPSNLAIVGRYILTPDIFRMLEAIPPGKGGEVQLSESLGVLSRHQPVYACEFEGVRYDAGTPLGLIKASVALALARPDMGAELKGYLKTIDLS